MESHFDLTGIALVTSVALVCGLALTRLRQPAVVGYILAGVVLGPTGLGLVDHAEGVRALAEIGVLMLLFLVGMELSVRTFLGVYRVALAWIVVQILASVGVTVGLGSLLGWPWQQSLVFGFIVALSGTAVAIKILEEVGELRTEMGRITVGILIAQDLAFVLLLMITNALSPQMPGLQAETLIRLAVAVALLAGLVALLSRRKRLVLPFATWFERNRDMVPLAAMAVCFILAALSGISGLSPAFGAFIAGFVLGNSTGRAISIRATAPIQSVLSVVFFLSVGLLIDLGYVWSNLGTVLLFLIVVTLVKTAINIGALRLVGQPWERAFPAGVVLASLSEFSFVLAAAGLAAGVLDADTQRLAMAVIALSWIVSPLWLASARRFHDAAADGIGSLGAILDRIYGSEIAATNRLIQAVSRLIRRERSGPPAPVNAPEVNAREVNAQDVNAPEPVACGMKDDVSSPSAGTRP